MTLEISNVGSQIVIKAQDKSFTHVMTIEHAEEMIARLKKEMSPLFSMEANIINFSLDHSFTIRMDLMSASMLEANIRLSVCKARVHRSESQSAKENLKPSKS